MPVTVRPYRPSDLAAVERILHAAYGHRLSPGMHARIAIGAEHALLGEHDGVPAGFVMATTYGNVAYIGSMGVDPAHQGHGVARAMMSRLVSALENEAVRGMLLDATGAGAPLYESFGFSDADRTVVFEREPAPERATDDAASEPPREMDVARAIVVDRTLCRCDRANVLRGFAREPDASVLVAQDGYLIGRGPNIGPFVAASAKTARALFNEAETTRGGARRMFVPESNAAACALATEAGFVTTRALRHMQRGPSPIDRARIFGQASLGHG